MLLLLIVVVIVRVGCKPDVLEQYLGVNISMEQCLVDAFGIADADGHATADVTVI